MIDDQTHPSDSDKPKKTKNLRPGGRVSGKKLRSDVERIERLDEGRKALGSDMTDLFAEAKDEGFDTKVMRKVIALRKMDTMERQEQESLLDSYMHALGMLPLFESGPLTGPQKAQAAIEEAAERFQEGANKIGAPVTLLVPGMPPVTIAPEAE